ncbi:protein transport protein SEC31-like [Daphnia pulicaria]|uniref:protein transport protein SEC31-like n=1 Tax=Daphnia pulicaria TaxID=35523 RepID=UPI001EE9B49E|nr:protein transport protein SEC31-like [Daphnia pulicaria]
MATPQPQTSTVVISTVAQTLPMTTPLVGSTSRIPTPTRLFGQPAATMPPTPKVNLFGRLLKAITPGSLTRSASVPHIPLNAGASNASVTTSITNQTFSTPSSTSVTAQPVMTSQPTSTVYNIVTPPTSVSQVPVSIIPPTTTTTPVTAPISTSAVPHAPATTVQPFIPPTSTSVAAPVSSSAAYPFTPLTTATIYAPTTSYVTHVPVSVPLPPRSSASVPFPPGSSASVPFQHGSSASVPFPPGSSASTSSLFSSWRNTGQPNFFGPTQPTQPPSVPPAQPPSVPPSQPPSVPPAQPPSVPPTQPPSFTPASSTSHAWPPNPPPTTSIQMSSVPNISIPTSATQVTSAPPYSTSHVPVSLGPSYGPGLSAYNPIASSSPFGMGSIYGPAITAALPTSSLFTPLTGFGHVPTSFPSISAPPFAPTNLTFASGFPGPSAPPPTTDNPHGVYTPDAWIHNLGTAHAAPSRSSIKPPRMKAPSFDGDPRNWPMFIQMFKVFVHDAVSSDAERIAHLHDALTPSIRKDIGGALLNPGLYQHALNELHKRYGNPQIVSQACTESILKLSPFKDNDFSALRAFSADLHSVVATLRLGGYGMELYSHATLSQLVSKLPPALKSRWGEKSWSMQPTLATVEDLDQWLDGVAMAERSIQASSIETPQQRSAKPTDEKRRVLHRPNVFNNTVTHDESDANDKTPRCPGCNSTHQHNIIDCRKFNEITVKERAQIVKDANLCLRCLGDDHLSRGCTRVERCSQPLCDGVHHPLLHGAPRLFSKPASAKPPVEFSGYRSSR